MAPLRKDGTLHDPSPLDVTRALKPFFLAFAVLLCVFPTGCSKEKKIAKQLARGEDYYLDGDYSAARLVFLEILQDQPKNETALIRLGSLWMDRGSAVQALPYLLSAKKVAPDKLDTRTELAVALLAIGHRGDALDEAASILDENPAHAECSRFLSQLAHSPEEIEEAKARFEKLLPTAPSTYHLCLASLALRDSESALGEKELRASIAADPKNHLALLGLARVLAARNEHEQALLHFQEAQKHLPRYSAARTAYPLYLIQRHDLAGARSLLETIVEDVSDFIPAQHLLARVYTQEQSYPQAFVVMDKILKLDPSALETIILRGRVLRLTGKTQQALTHLQSAMEIDLYQDSINLHFEIAQVHLALKNPPLAIASLKKATSSRKALPEARLQLASLLLRTGNASAAQTELDEHLDADPGDRQALILLAETHRTLGQLNKAVIILKDLIDKESSELLPHLRLASIYQAQGKLTEAREHFSNALQLAPGNLYVLQQLFELDLLEEKYEAAHLQVDEMLASTPPLPGAHYLKGRIHHAQRNWTAAVQSLKTSRASEKESVQVSLLLVSCYLELAERDQALKELTELTPNISNTPRPLLAAALYYEELGKFTQARKVHERVLKLAPDTLTSLNNLAMLYTEHFQETAKALDLVTRARTLDPHDPSILDTLGWIHFKRGDYAQALAIFKKSATELTDNLDAQHHLGMAAYMMARSDLALPALSKVAQDAPDSALRPHRLLALLEDFDDPTPRHSAEDLRRVMKDSPKDLIALLLLARTQNASQNFKKAEQTLLQALEINSKLAIAEQALARIYHEALAAPALAASHARAARELAPEDAEVTALLGRILLRAGDHKQAHPLLTESHGTLSPTADLAHDLAWTTYYLGQQTKAVTLMREALSLNPSEAIKTSAHRFLAMVQLANDPDLLTKSRSKIEEILAEESDHLPALFALARLSQAENNHQKTEALLLGIYKTAPDFLPALKELAFVLSEDPERSIEALALATKARDLDPEDLRLARTLARVSYHQKNYSYAIQLYQQGADTTPLDARSLFYLGMAYHHSKEPSKAADALARALDSGLPEAEAATARETLEALK